MARCYKCQEIGHYANRCPLTIGLIDGEEGDVGQGMDVDSAYYAEAEYDDPPPENY